jgi:hypothetical protein
MSVFGRLNYNFDSAKFGANNELTDGQKLTLNYPSPLYTWQSSDLAGSSVVNYFQNPHSANLALMTIYANQLLTYSNTQLITYNVASIEANTLNALANNLLIEISSFTDHTNRISGVTESTNKLTIPDYQIAMSIGRQVLQICNQVDGVQNNAPILGNFTSLAIVSDVSNSVIQLASSAATLNASIYPTTITFYDAEVGDFVVISGQASGISRASMNTIIATTQTAFNLLNSRRVGDTTFYTNSISLIQDYNTILQFSNLGVNSSYLIKDLNIGTTKLQNNLLYSVPSGFPNNVYSGASTRTVTDTATSTEGLSVSGVVPGTYTTATFSVDAYGRVTNAVSVNPFPPGGIIMWSGTVATIPGGWYLCDGSNGTPDLRNRFVVGAGSTYVPAATGGSANAVVVSHTHTATVTDPGHNHSYTSHNNIGVQSGGNLTLVQYGISPSTLNTGTANTGISVTNSTTGVSDTNANLPPYYALAFIMKA